MPFERIDVNRTISDTLTADPTLNITGCQFSLAVMSDNYISMILNAIAKVNTKKVWSMTDSLSTVYQGQRAHVVDCVKACFTEVNDGCTHITMETTFSNGCHEDAGNDCYFTGDDVILNESDKQFEVLSKIAFYPLGITDYTDHIAHAVKLSVDDGLFVNSSHYALVIKGDVNKIFDYFNKVMEYAEKNIQHYVLQATLSVNSPTKSAD